MEFCLAGPLNDSSLFATPCVLAIDACTLNNRLNAARLLPLAAFLVYLKMILSRRLGEGVLA